MRPSCSSSTGPRTVSTVAIAPQYPDSAAPLDSPPRSRIGSPVFKIREDVKFWDGKPLTTDDVVYGLKRNLDEAAGSLTGDDDLKHEGRGDQAEAAVKQAGEKAKDAVGDIKDAFKK